MLSIFPDAYSSLLFSVCLSAVPIGGISQRDQQFLNLLQFPNIQFTSVPLYSLVSDNTNPLDPQFYLHWIEELDLLPFQVSTKRHLIFKLLESFNWAFEAREVFCLLRNVSFLRRVHWASTC